MVQYIDTLHDRTTSIENKISTRHTAHDDTEHVPYCSTRQDFSAVCALIANHSNPVIHNIGTSQKKQDGIRHPNKGRQLQLEHFLLFPCTQSPRPASHIL